MTYPIQVITTIDFNNGATFGYPFVIGDPAHGILGTNTLSDGSSPSLSVDISDIVTKISLKGGYNLLQDQFEAATGTIRLYDSTGDWNPENTLSPYYGLLVPNRKIRVAAVYGSNSYYLFSGYTTAYNYSYPKDQEIAYLDISVTDAFRLFNLSNITTVASATAGQDTGTRIGKILDQISWPSGMRTLDTGQTTVQADPGSARTALQALKNAEFSEQGAFYIDTTGNAKFVSRLNLEKKAGATATYFSNAGDGIPYFNITTALDDKLIINQANITPIGLATQTATNAASVTKYFPHTLNQPNLIVQTAAEALNIAQAYVATRAETTVRVDNITLDLSTPNYDAGITAALGSKYFDTFKIKNVQQNNTTITKTLQMVGYAHEITPTSWKTTFTTSEPIIDSFIIGSSLYGIIGQSVMTY